CGSVLDPAQDAVCPQCSAAPDSVSQPQPRLWGAGTGLLVWIASVAVTIGMPIFFGIAYLILRAFQTGESPSLQSLTNDLALVLVTVGSILPAHLLILTICWLVVTSRGKRPFLQTLGWGWYPLLQWVLAVGLAFLMFGLAIVFQKLLPHRETGLEKMLKLGYSVRVMIAIVAVVTPP